MCSSFVYIVATGKNGQIHTGLTSNLVQRVWQHRSGQLDATGVPAGCAQLVWYEAFDNRADAVARLEKMARWPQAWLTRQIEDSNPDWANLWADLEDQPHIEVSQSYTCVRTRADTAYPVIRPIQKVA